MMPGTVAKRSRKSGVAPGNGPGGRRLEPGECVPLTSKQSERLASLYETYGNRLVRYACSRLMRTGRSNGEAWALGEDIVQSMWLQVGRTDTKGLLGDETWPEEKVRQVLFARVKRAMSDHFNVLRASERPVDWSDPATCNMLCPLLPSGCAWVDLPPYLAKMVSALPEREREALLLKLDGTPHRIMGERMGCSESTADRLAKTALLLLQIDNPELSGPPASVESLPQWEQRALAERSTAQREVLLRLDETARQALLLNDKLPTREIAQRLGVARERVMGATMCAPVLRALDAKDMAVAA
ncbi:sigma factor-like helix-turn-helix DNA-binding protein [Streptomyces sp. NPDC006692]|uniref:sigma factor-like helix-turn-helix DNA-binding protein n=1 Tax=Streptomyces sp. NPDC006692 TaxID=3364758 RepID=UPI0036AB37DC